MNTAHVGADVKMAFHGIARPWNSHCLLLSFTHSHTHAQKHTQTYLNAYYTFCDTLINSLIILPAPTSPVCAWFRVYSFTVYSWHKINKSGVRKREQEHLCLCCMNDGVKVQSFIHVQPVVVMWIVLHPSHPDEDEDGTQSSWTKQSTETTFWDYHNPKI